jgi:hypothetical protein
VAQIEILQRCPVHIDPDRDLHGPCVTRTATGDWLLCHQDSAKHQGGDGYVHQWRSSDQGGTWLDEGAAADWRERGLDSLFGEYGLAPNGQLVMFVQRREPVSGNAGIRASWYCTSTDNGRSWTERGPVDDSNEHAVTSARNVIVCGEEMLVGCWSRLGHALYASRDSGSTWERRSVIFPPEYPGFGELVRSGPPYYPHVVACADGTLFSLCYVTPPVNRCFARRSADGGHTWDPIEERPDLPVWAPRLKLLQTGALILSGRDVERKATVLCSSADSGRTWSEPEIIDKADHDGSYAYTDSLPLDGPECWVFTSSPQSPGRGDIVGVRLRLGAG